MKKKLEEKKTRLLFTAIISAVAYGGWALYINLDTNVWLRATMVQAICSFLAGYFVSSIVERIFRSTAPPWRFPLSSLGPYSVTLVIFASLHGVAGTEEIFKTILPNLIIGTAYFQIYCIGLEKLAKQEVVNE